CQSRCSLRSDNGRARREQTGWNEINCATTSLQRSVVERRRTEFDTTAPRAGNAIVFWGAQAASLFFSAACRKAPRTRHIETFGTSLVSSASCRRLQAGSLCSPEGRTRRKFFCARSSISRKFGRCFRRRSAAQNQKQKRPRRRTIASSRHFAGCCWRVRSRKSSLVSIEAASSRAEFISAKARKL